MNREELYREIGNIDDDLICAASDACGKPKSGRLLYRVAGIAACFCILCGGILYGFMKDTIHFHPISAPFTSKAVVPEDENAVVIAMSYQDLLAYYGIEKLPDAVGDELTKETQSYFALYQDQKGNTLFDTNILYYSSADRSKLLWVSIAKAEENVEDSHENLERSRISGIPILLASASSDGHVGYWAEFCVNEISVRIGADGLQEDEFIAVLKELIPYLKT